MGLKHHQYADDTQLYFVVRESHYKDDLNIIEKCTSSVQDWFLAVTFYLTQLSQKSLPSVLPPSAALPSAQIQWQSLDHRCHSLTTSTRSAYKSTRICHLMRKSMQFADRVTITPELCDGSVTINLSTDAANTVACVIVGSRLDYCNSLLHNISKNIQKLPGYKTISYV